MHEHYLSEGQKRDEAIPATQEACCGSVSFLMERPITSTQQRIGAGALLAQGLTIDAASSYGGVPANIALLHQHYPVQPPLRRMGAGSRRSISAESEPRPVRPIRAFRRRRTAAAVPGWWARRKRKRAIAALPAGGREGFTVPRFAAPGAGYFSVSVAVRRLRGILPMRCRPPGLTPGWRWRRGLTEVLQWC